MSIGVVLNLNFRARVPGAFSLFIHMKHDATVATLGDIKLQRQLKAVILLGRNNIASTFTSSRQRAIDDLPAIADTLGLVITPALGRLAVE